MRKILVLLVILGVLVIMGSYGVFGADQGINVTIGDNITVMITPTEVLFGNVFPGVVDAPSVNGDITFDPDGSNVDINIDTTVTGEPFKSGLEFSGVLAEGIHYDINCVMSGSVCTYNPLSVTPTLSVPTGSPAGVKTGTITYTITGTTPP